MKELLEKAIGIALIAHKGQVDKGGMPYILHPLAVMKGVDDLDAKIVAVLHDVLEDSDMTPAALVNDGFPAEILQALDLLTKKPGQLYPLYIQQIAQNALAKKVKLADLKENMDERRLQAPLSAEDRQRLTKYRDAYQCLSKED
jgi:(p)ppGpp synthase/HD superfamily hydrolase